MHVYKLTLLNLFSYAIVVIFDKPVENLKVLAIIALYE